MTSNTADHFIRRRCLLTGGLACLGLNETTLQRLRAASSDDDATGKHRGNSCVFIFLFGGPSHIDLWDMKPQAPAEVRGEFAPIATRVPGMQLCEHLPRLARQMDQILLLRSMTHHMPVHGPACSELYTGREYQLPPTTDQARPDDWPSVSSLVMRYARSPVGLPPSIVLPVYSHFVGQSLRIAGQTGGRMGDQFDPLLIECDPGASDFEYEGFRLLPDVDLERLEHRFDLLDNLQTATRHTPRPAAPPVTAYAKHEETAQALLHQARLHRALDLQRLPVRQRERYGLTTFGQSLLMAANLVEAGVPLVTANFDDQSKFDKRSPLWDTHHDNFAKLKDVLCPLFDQAFAAFIEDLQERGLLESTLVVAVGEFGRTPRIGQFSQNAMTLQNGRDHWPHAFTALLAGGGVRGGQIYGATTRDGGQVAENPTTPADLSATILHHLGIDTTLEYDDTFQQLRRRVTLGRVLADLS